METFVSDWEGQLGQDQEYPVINTVAMFTCVLRSDCSMIVSHNCFQGNYFRHRDILFKRVILLQLVRFSSYNSVQPLDIKGKIKGLSVRRYTDVSCFRTMTSTII